MYSLMHDLESDWTEQLENLNIYDNIDFIYNSEGVAGDTRIGNTILCYTVLAYDNKSKFLEPHKDRWDNKRKIIVKLAGLSALTQPIYSALIENKHKGSSDLANWYIAYQKDWRWEEALTLMEFHAMASNMSKKGAIDAQEGIQIGKMLAESRKCREAADEIMNTLKKEFLSVDIALEKEGRPRMTDIQPDNSDFMKFEIYLNELKNLPVGN